MADTWEAEERNWSPVQLSHCFDEVKQVQPEVKVKSVLQMIDYLEARFREKKRIKNNQVIDSSNNAKKYAELRRTLQAFSSYFFTDITEQFLLDFAPFGLRNEASGMVTKGA